MGDRKRQLSLVGVGVVVFAVLIMAFGGGATEPDPDPSAVETADIDADDVIISGESPSDTEPAPEVEATEIDCDDPEADTDDVEYQALCGAAVDDEGIDDEAAFRFSDLPTITLDELPSEALDTLELIEDGGPYPYRQDDGVFQNREGLLPPRPNGHYREYTVDTPGSPDRGARRIVAGADGERYWTDDHYASFSEIVF